MSKTQPAGKTAKPKSQKDMIKELEDKLFGEKNKTKKKELEGMLKKLKLDSEMERKKKAEEEAARKKTVVRQLIPVGVDPKSVECINFINGNCEKGDACQFGHGIKKEEKKDEPKEKHRQKVICRFLIDAMNKGELQKDWTCPLPKCEDVHRLTELSNNKEVEVSLEEFIELQRLTLDTAGLTPVTKETFEEWKAKKQREEELHAKRVAALSCKGADLFMQNPEMFEDDEEVDEIDYGERNYEMMNEEEECES